MFVQVNLDIVLTSIAACMVHYPQTIEDQSIQFRVDIFLFRVVVTTEAKFCGEQQNWKQDRSLQVENKSTLSNEQS